eukprot:CAMPEP_0182453034 /NCGR_PEP_ID=MMETSP1319-20130603/269_1 /TAXON_ID=172717 /ORGANISM="Bolidomonas pacifica, Strain RCC208" /LENGTH=351 /DNA_ID=CAMNT_0024650921 /DNA_START=55 /DNA_END=1113 /DNA_ORIENTATION=+
MASFALPSDEIVKESAPSFYAPLHASYIQKLSSKLSKPGSYEGAVTSHLRMSGVYWAVAGLSLMKKKEEVDDMMRMSSIVEWVFQCYDTTSTSSAGGFSGNVGHDPHLLYTLSAVQLLAMAGRLDDPRFRPEKTVEFIKGLMLEDGSFKGDKWGEVDTRFSYCALSTLAILKRLDAVDTDRAAAFVAECKNFDGGFGCLPGAESHAGQIFCCVGALAIAGRLDLVDADLLCWWLAERQTSGGGLNGRPEKQADVCYSWWILSCLSILGRVDWINKDKLSAFILRCQDPEGGGIADRPDNVADVFHTFFGIAGLLLIGHFEGDEAASEYRHIDPVYALPVDVVEKLGLSRRP